MERSCPDRAAHSPQAGRVAKKEPMVVIARDEEGGDPSSRYEKESARRQTPRATRRIKEECEAELCEAEAIPSLWRRQSRRSPSCEAGQHHQYDEQAPPTLHMVDAMVNNPKFRHVGRSGQQQ